MVDKRLLERTIRYIIVNDEMADKVPVNRGTIAMYVVGQFISSPSVMFRVQMYYFQADKSKVRILYEEGYD